jgi:DNA invertase Pin-like site-specific DNA recombinase
MTTTTNPEPALAYSYLRFSRAEQEEGDTVRRQTDLRKDFLRRHPHLTEDTTLKFEDRGVSGYTGEHRKNPKHALAQFLDQVERGRIARGSYLIVENLDRLTRENPRHSIPMVMNLINAGIWIVQLAPTELVYTEDMELPQLMTMLWDLARGYGESKRKSTLVGPAWREKQRKAVETGEPHGGAVPEWIELIDSEYRIKAGAKAAIKKIFRCCAEGQGFVKIAGRLNKEGVPNFTGAETWARSYVRRILHNRAVLGEYQPHQGSKQRVPRGEPKRNYFPPAVTEQEWYRAHNGMESRKGRCGRPGKHRPFIHCFQGLLHCALDRCPLHAHKNAYLLSARVAAGERPHHGWRPFPLDAFINAVLSQLVELKSTDLFEDPGGARIAELSGRLAEVETRLSIATRHFNDDPENATWAGQIDRLDPERRRLAFDLAQARQEAAHPLTSVWAEAVQLMSRNEPERLRQCLLETIEEIYCVLHSRNAGRYRLAMVAVYFRGGGHARTYQIFHRPARKSIPEATLIWTGKRAAAEKGKHIDPAVDPIEVSEGILAGLDVRSVSEAQDAARWLDNYPQDILADLFRADVKNG